MRAMDGDYLTCGQCLKQFPLQRITLFIQHKKVDCVGDIGIPYEERDLKCFYCPKGFLSAWGLLVHVQITHSLQIFVEHTPISSKQQHFNDVTELNPKQTIENAISNGNSDTVQDVPTMEDKDCNSAKDVPTMDDIDSITAKDVPTMDDIDSITAKDVPTMEDKACITAKHMPTIEDKACITAKYAQTMEDKDCITAKYVPTMEDKDCITAKVVPTMEDKDCITAKYVSRIEDKDCITAKYVPTIEDKDCITAKDVPTIEDKDCITAKDVPTIENKDFITAKEAPTMEPMCVFLNEDKDNAVYYEYKKNVSKCARKSDVGGIYSKNQERNIEKYISNETLKDSLDNHLKTSPLDDESIIPAMSRLKRSVEVNRNAITNLPVLSVERDLISEHDASCLKSSLSAFPKAVKELSKPPPLVSDLSVSTKVAEQVSNIGLEVTKSVSPENIRGVAAKISQSDGDCCDNQGCGITVIPGSHQDLQKCCNAVVPKKRKRHMELKHMPFSWSSSRYARMRMLKRSLISASKSRTISHSGQLPSSTIFIDVEPDTYTNIGQMSCHQQDPSIDIPMEDTSIGTSNLTNHPLKRYPADYESRAKSLILQPGAVFSIPFSYSGSRSGTSTSIPISIQAQMSDSNSVISGSLPTNKDRHYKDLESKCHKTEVVSLNEKMNDPELRRRKYPTSKPFQCDTCPMAFNQRIHLKKHTSKHTGIKPYKCDECDYSTVERSHLKVHIRIHTGEKPFKCTYCEYATAQNSTLKIHLKRHHGGKLFTCDSCDKTFTQIEQLKGHKSGHPHVAIQSTEKDVLPK